MSPHGTSFLLTLVISSLFSFVRTCRTFQGLEEKNYVLLGYTFDSSVTEDSFSCAERCLCYDQCQSYNYALSGAQQGLCELNSAGRNASTPLQYRPGFVFVQATHKQKSPSQEAIQATACTLPPASPSVSIPPPASFKSCVDHWNGGQRMSGQYPIYQNQSSFFNVYCDFVSESGWVWTLVMSQSHKNRAMPKLKTVPLYENAPINQSTPNWAAYRLSLHRMKELQSGCTHWRATCSFPVHGVDFRDYVRAKFTEFDLLTFRGVEICKKTEYMNVRGHNCTGCTSAWWQGIGNMLHHDSWENSCEFGRTTGAVYTEDNFGYYGATNPNFRCCSTDDSTTNHWFGRRVT